MRNSPGLPITCLIAAVILGIIVAASRDGGPLTELQLGGIAWVIGLVIFGVQGLISVAVEGQELHEGRTLPRLTSPLTFGVVVLALALLAVASLLSYGVANDWGVGALGGLAGAGCILIALIAIFYKEGFIGDEACFDDREDGVPW